MTRTATTVGRALVVGGVAGLLLGGCALPSAGGPPWAIPPDITSAPVTSAVAPSAEVVALADAAVMTDLGRAIFYEARPIVVDAAGFHGQCTDAETGQELDAVGCWRPGDQRIVVYRPADPRLEDYVVETAAHEMLHAAYDRLTPEERAEVDALTQAELDLLPADHRIREQIAGSVRQAPGNEGTERFAYLGASVAGDGGFAPALEAYYGRFLADRQALVARAGRTRATLDAMIESINAGWQQLAAAEQANADARGAISYDETLLQGAYSVYNQAVDAYNAAPAEQRAGLGYGWTLGDGTVIETRPALEAFDALNAWIGAVEARLADRRAALGPAEAAVADERARLEAARADYEALVAQLDPTTE